MQSCPAHQSMPRGQRRTAVEFHRASKGRWSPRERRMRKPAIHRSRSVPFHRSALSRLVPSPSPSRHVFASSVFHSSPDRLMNRRTLVKALVPLVLPLLGVTVRPALVESHAVLVKSVPAARAVLTRAPGRVQLWFSERLEPAFSNASVWSGSGKQVDKRDASVSPDDPKELSVSLGTLEAGTYTVRCRILSVDGHVVETNFPFTIKSAS